MEIDYIFPHRIFGFKKSARAKILMENGWMERPKGVKNIFYTEHLCESASASAIKNLLIKNMEFWRLFNRV